MLNRLDIFTEKTDLGDVYSDLSVKIHGFLMNSIQPEYAAELHKDSVRPFSIYTVEGKNGYITRISTLDERAVALIDALEGVERIHVVGTKDDLKVTNVYRYPEITADELVAGFDFDKCAVNIITPAIYKVNGRPKHNPSIIKYFDAVLQKLSKYEEIAVPTSRLTLAFNKTDFGKYELFTAPFLSGGSIHYGLCGKAELFLPPDEDGIIMKTVLAYATYCGFGGNTAQGMGGFSVEKIG